MKDPEFDFKNYRYNESIKYTDTEILEEATLFSTQGSGCFLYRETNSSVYFYWAVDKLEDLLEALSSFSLKFPSKKVVIEFIPKALTAKLEQLGFNLECEYKDFWLEKLQEKRFEHCAEYHVREAKPDELGKAGLITARNEGRGFDALSENDFKEWRRNDDSRVTAVELNGEVVGIAALRIYGQEQKILWVRVLAVDPDFHRMGIGRSILIDALCWGQNKQAVKSFLATDILNDNAIKMYQNLGYKPDSENSQINMCRKPLPEQELLEC